LVAADHDVEPKRSVRASRGARALRRWRAPVGFLAVSVAALLLFTLWPIVRAFWISLHDWSFLRDDQPFVGFENYRHMFDDPRFWNALRNTFVYTAATVTVNVGFALILAVNLIGQVRGRTFLRAAYFLPVVTSFGIMAIVFGFLFSPDIGLIVHWMTAVGLPEIAWLREPLTAMIAVILVGIWKVTGFNMVILLAGLQGIPEEHYEAAVVDGASPWQRFLHITVPGVRQQLLFVAVISVIASLQAFDQIFVMTRGGPLFATETIVTYLFTQGFERFRVGYAAALSVALFCIILVASITQLRLFRFGEVD
jgi:ABC-type sugar transport system permease subunit